MKKIHLYELSVILFVIIVPILGIIINDSICSNSMIKISLKWFVFSAIGLRLLSAGIKQVFYPEFTAKEIFKI